MFQRESRYQLDFKNERCRRSVESVLFQLSRGCKIKHDTLYAERHNNVVTKSKEWFATTYMETHLTSFTLQSPLEYMTVPYPLLSTEGKLGIRTVDGFAMPSSLKNKELAWEFIKYCLSAREDPSVYELTGFRWLCSEGFYLNTAITDVLRQI